MSRDVTETCLGLGGTGPTSFVFRDAGRHGRLLLPGPSSRSWALCPPPCPPGAHLCSRVRSAQGVSVASVALSPPQGQAPTVAVPVRSALTACQGCSCVSPWTVIPILPSRRLRFSKVPRLSRKMWLVRFWTWMRLSPESLLFIVYAKWSREPRVVGPGQGLREAGGQVDMVEAHGQGHAWHLSLWGSHSPPRVALRDYFNTSPPPPDLPSSPSSVHRGWAGKACGI